MTQAIHMLDLMLTLCGPVQSVQAMLATTKLHKMDAENFASAGLVYESGAVGSITATTSSYPGSPESILIDGTLGSAKFNAGALTINWRDGRTETFGAETAAGGGSDPMAFSHLHHLAILENFMLAVEDKAEMIASGRSALNVHRLIDAMETSSKQNGKRVDLRKISL